VDLRRLEYFLAVVEHGRVTTAAAALHVAQPSLSQAIRALERDLGVELFRRDGRGLTPTEAGKALVEPARRVLDDLAIARSAVDNVVELSAGWLEVAAHDLLCLDPMVRVLAAFHRRYAGVPVRLHEPQDDDELVRMLVDGRCEVALSYTGGRISRVTGLKVTPVGAQDAWVLLPPADAGLPDPLPLAALGGRAIVMSMSGFEAPRAVLGAALQEAGVVLRPSVITRHRESIVPLVRAGAGISFTNGRYAEVAASAGVITRRLEPAVVCEFGVLHREGSLSPAARGFVAVLAHELEAPVGGHEGSAGAGAEHSQAL
jgi:DNA-binding transcriptional LysR family regulator